MILPCRKNGEQNYTILKIMERNVMSDQNHDSSAMYWMTLIRKKLAINKWARKTLGDSQGRIYTRAKGARAQGGKLKKLTLKYGMRKKKNAVHEREI
jgi:hypothetical protein